MTFSELNEALLDPNLISFLTNPCPGPFSVGVIEQNGCPAILLRVSALGVHKYPTYAWVNGVKVDVVVVVKDDYQAY